MSANPRVLGKPSGRSRKSGAVKWTLSSHRLGIESFEGESETLTLVLEVQGAQYGTIQENYEADRAM
jgi:hypothetical protein